MGADSIGVDGSNCVTIRKDPKVFQNGPFLIGFTTSYRMGQLLMDASFPHPGNKDNFEYMRTQFVKVVRTRLKEGGYVKVDNREESGEFMVGFHGRIFVVEEDFQVAESADDFMAVGQGSQEALGVMYATPDMEPVQRLLLAMSASERYRSGVRGPFVFVKES